MDEDIQRILNSFNLDVDNYITTLNVLKLFGHEMCCAPGSITPKKDTVCWCGRRMTNSENVKITPDLVIKVDKLFGTVAEVKSSLSKNQDYWEKHFDQLLAYDDDLKGWNEEEGQQIKHDVVLLVPFHLSVLVKDYIEEKVDKGELKFERSFAAISFHREDMVQTFYCFCKFYGDISDSEKNEELRKVARVPSNKILPFYDYCFCDEVPPLPYTMDNIWSQIGYYIDQDALIDGNDIDIIFDLNQLICDLKNANSPLIIDNCETTLNGNNDPRNPSYPKTKWINAALKEFTKLQYFENNESDGTYKINLRKYKRVKAPLEEFKKKIAQTKIKKERTSKNEDKQLSLELKFQ